ncbi:MAG: AsmA-like C-terminal region-containing protein [Candidatus Gastranaerophilaceae bacterium]
MKVLKIFSICLFIVLISSYMIFLFILPNVLKLDNYQYELNDKENAQKGIIIKAENIKLLTTWNLSVGASVEQINAYYKSGEKFGQLDNAKVSVSLPYLILKQIKFDKISLDSIIAHLDIDKNGKFELEDYIPLSENSNQNTSFEIPYGLQFSENMPDLQIKKYSLLLTDTSINNKYALKGNSFKITDFDLNKKIRIQTIGKILFGENEQFKYDLNIHSFVIPQLISQEENPQNTNQFNLASILRNIDKINLKANLFADIKIKNDNGSAKPYGKINISELSSKINTQQLPNSNINLNIENDKINILSDLYTAKDEKTTINGYFKYGKNSYIDLSVKNNELALSNLFSIINTILPALDINYIEGIRANGLIKADFNIKSDFKTINSSGYLKVTNANLYYNLYNIALKSIQADIDFSRNQININRASAICNGAPLNLTGAVNSNAYANIHILADKIPLKAAIAALGQFNLLKENNINSGIITLNGIIKGNLNKVKPEININADNINLFNKPSNANIILSKATINAQTTGLKTNGNGLINGLKISIKGLPTLSVPNSKISFNEKDIKLDDVYVKVNNSKIDLLGTIQDYSNANTNINITAAGMVDCNDIRNSLEKDIRKLTKAKGRLPIAISITGNNKIQNINGQFMANNSNYLSLLDISSLSGKTSLINASMKLENNNLKIDDISINSHSTNKSLTDNFANNLANSTKVLSIKGNINNLSAKYQQLSGINISIPNQITFAIPNYTNSKVQLKGNLNISGSTLNPIITGMLNIPFVSIPQLGFNGKNITINTTKNIIDIFCNQLNIADSSINIVATINNNFKNGINITSMLFNATNLNVDTLCEMVAKLPQNTVAPGTNAALSISNGKGKIERLQSGTIVVTNVTSDFNMKNNLFKLNNIEAIAYGGKVVGNATYNMLYSNTNINLQGRNLNAQTAMYGCTGIKNLINGTLNFDAFNFTTRGLTEIQIMKSLNGTVNFIVSNGQMGTLGKLENLLYAQNILANNILKTTLGTIIGAVKVKKTGDFKYINGTVKLSNGWANLDKIQISGSAMSMYIKGKYNILNNNANLIILGRVSDEVVSVLGPIGSFSVNSLIASIPKIGQVTASLINQITTNPNGENISNLPELTPYQANTKIYKAAIDGSVESTSSVKYFKWLATPKVDSQTQTTTTSKQNTAQDTIQQAIDNAKNQIQNSVNKVLDTPIQANPTTPPTESNNNGVADFINKLPDLSR